MDEDRPPATVGTVSRRFELLDALADGEQQVRDLVERLDSSRSTVNRALRDLQEADLADRADGGYRATLIGKLALARTRAYFAEMEELSDAAAALEPLPPDAPLPPEAVIDGEVELGTPPNPYRPNETVVEALRRATRWRSVHGMITDSRLIEVGYERVMSGNLTAAPTVGPHVLDLFREEFPDRTADLLASGRYDLAVTRDLPPFGLVLFDDDDGTHLLVGIGRPSGGMHAVIRNDDPDAIAWGESFYEGVRSSAIPLEEYEGTDETDPEA